MNNETVRQEAERIASQTGRYIPPCRLAAMTTAAGKVLKVITEGGVAMSYQDCLLVLQIVRQGIRLAANGEETINE